MSAATPWLLLLALALVIALLLVKFRTMIRTAYFWIKIPWGPITRYIQILTFWGDAAALSLKAMSETNEPLGILWGRRFAIMISDPDHVRTFCNDKNLLNKGSLYDFMEPFLGEGVFTAREEKWKVLRKHVASSFQSVPLKSMFPVFLEETDIFVNLLKNKVGREFKSMHHLLRLTASIILRSIYFDKNLDVQRSKLSFIDDIDTCKTIINTRFLFYPMHFDFIFNLSSKAKQYKEAAERIFNFFSPIFQEMEQECRLDQESNMTPKNVFINNFFRKDDFTSKEIMENLLIVIVGGYDSLSMELGYTLLLLGQNPKIQEAVYQEDKELSQKRDGRPLQLEDLDDYEYVERVVKEAMRLFPVTIYITREAKADVQIGKYVVPQGADVYCALMKTHRDPNEFPNPLQFNPDNFLPENVAKRHPYAYIPLSAGVRGCIVNKYAIVVMKVVISAIVREFHIFSEGDVQTLTDRMKHGFVGKDEAQYPIRLEARSKT